MNDERRPVASTSTVQCGACGGLGTVPIEHDHSGQWQEYEPCVDCGGAGYVPRPVAYGTEVPRPETPEDEIRRFCKLREEVAENVVGFSNPNDCICREGGFWKGDTDGSYARKGWRSTGEALEYIERVVRASFAKGAANAPSPIQPGPGVAEIVAFRRAVEQSQHALSSAAPQEQLARALWDDYRLDEFQRNDCPAFSTYADGDEEPCEWDEQSEKLRDYYREMASRLLQRAGGAFETQGQQQQAGDQ